jgi:hypothetical protein
MNAQEVLGRRLRGGRRVDWKFAPESQVAMKPTLAKTTVEVRSSFAMAPSLEEGCHAQA